MPYNPGASYQGGALLYSGIMRGMEQFGAGIEAGADRRERRKRQDKEDQERERARQDTAKRARATAKALKEPLGLSDADIEASDAATLEGLVDGYFYDRRRQQEELAMQQLAGTVADQEAARKAEQGFNERMALRATPPAPLNDEMAAKWQPTYPSPEQTMMMLAEEGAPLSTQTRMAQNMALLAQAGSRGQADAPLPFQAGGMKGIYSPETGQYSIDQALLGPALPIEGTDGQYVDIGGKPFQKRASPVDDVLSAKQQALAHKRSTLAQLEALKADGVKAARIDAQGQVREPGFWSNDTAIEDLIKDVRRETVGLEEELEALGGETSVEVDMDLAAQVKQLVEEGRLNEEQAVKILRGLGMK